MSELGLVTQGGKVVWGTLLLLFIAVYPCQPISPPHPPTFKDTSVLMGFCELNFSVLEN